MGQFAGKSVIVTGASAGIGEAAAFAFAQEGANVCLSGTSQRTTDAAQEIERRFGRPALAVRGDIADVNVCAELVRQTAEAFGSLDVLVNCAGIVPTGTVLDADEQTFARAFDVNVKGTFFLSKAAAEYMVPRRRGVIVNVGSIAGLVGPRNRALYSATKGAVISLTRAMASDFAAFGIRVNCVCPGMVMTPSLRQRLEATGDPQRALDSFSGGIPIGRVGNAQEIASAILFAAMENNGFMTGSIITVDGGASL